MRIFLIISLLLIVSCSRIRITEGTDTEKPKVDVSATKNCKLRVKISKQKWDCKWKF